MAKKSNSNAEITVSFEDLSPANSTQDELNIDDLEQVKKEDPFEGVTTPLGVLNCCSNIHKLPFEALAELTDNSLFAQATIIHIDVLPFPSVPKLPPMASQVEVVEMEEEKPEVVPRKRGRKPKKRGFEEWENAKMSAEAFYNMVIVQDNGEGMSFTEMQTFLQPVVSQPKNGERREKGLNFKSGMMRLARDALVFSIKGKDRSIGFLSRSYLQYSNKSIIPVVHWQGLKEQKSDENCREHLSAIKNFSPFSTLDLLQEQFEAIGSSGTRIVLFNLQRYKGCRLELDFTREHEILYRDDLRATTREPELYSLRHQLSILYESPRFKIYLRKKKIFFQKTSEVLYRPKVEYYKPTSPSSGIPMDSRGIRVLFGINTSNKDLCGLLVYHRKRLILKYYHLQKIHTDNKSSKYTGVVCLLDVPFLEPNASKTDFKQGEELQNLKSWMSTQIKRYWKSCKIDTMDGGKGIGHFWNKKRKPQDVWIQCDHLDCLKWRRIPHKIAQTVQDNWTCKNCQEEEETTSYSMMEGAPRKIKEGKRKEKEPVKEKRKRGRKPKHATSSHPSMDINEARFIVLKDDIRSIEMHLPFFALSPDWQEERAMISKRLEGAKSPKDLPQVLECINHLRESIISDYTRSTWNETDWINRLRVCTNVENAQELVNDLDYLCLDWDKISVAEGNVRDSEGEDTEEDLPIFESASPFPPSKRQRTLQNLFLLDDQEDIEAQEETLAIEEIKLEREKEEKAFQETKRKHQAEISGLRKKIASLAKELDQERKSNASTPKVSLHFSESPAEIPRVGPSVSIFQSLRDRMIQDGAEKRPQYFLDPFLGISNEKELVAKGGGSLLAYFQAFNSFFPRTETPEDDLQALF